jgi:hypothetical protein
MNKEEYLKFHEHCCTRMIDITKKKNHDYAGEGTDPFKNFRQVEHLGVCSVEQGFLTRMSDKMSRITTFVQKGILQVSDESVDDTILDLSNYCILMLGYIESKREKAMHEEKKR